MRRTMLRFMLSPLLAAMALAPTTLLAEVSVEVSETDVTVVILGIIEGPDPIPQVIWEPVRDVDPAWILNPDGAPRGDGRPDVSIDPVTGWPHVVWAYNNGSDHDIAYSRWDGDGWLPTQFLTFGTGDELGPRVHADVSGIYVVWWEDGPRSDEVWLSVLPRLGGWNPPELVDLGQGGARPTVVTWGGTILVAAEVDDGEGGTDVVLSTSQGNGAYVTELVGSTTADLPLEIVLHAEQDKLWMDWRDSTTNFAYRVFDGSAWGPSGSIPWTDASWLKLAEARQMIRKLVMSAP